MVELCMIRGRNHAKFKQAEAFVWGNGFASSTDHLLEEQLNLESCSLSSRSDLTKLRITTTRLQSQDYTSRSKNLYY